MSSFILNSHISSVPDPQNPLFPVEIDDYLKLFDYVLTADGLIYFQNLKRKYILGKEMTLDEYNKLRLVYVYMLRLTEIQKKFLHGKMFA